MTAYPPGMMRYRIPSNRIPWGNRVAMISPTILPNAAPTRQTKLHVLIPESILFSTETRQSGNTKSPPALKLGHETASVSALTAGKWSHFEVEENFHFKVLHWRLAAWPNNIFIIIFYPKAILTFDPFETFYPIWMWKQTAPAICFWNAVWNQWRCKSTSLMLKKSEYVVFQHKPNEELYHSSLFFIKYEKNPKQPFTLLRIKKKKKKRKTLLF